LTDSVLTDASPDAGSVATGTEQKRALAFLRQVARLALEGQTIPARSVSEEPVPIRAPVPLHARPLLDRLAGIRLPYESLEQVQVDLAGIQSRPAEISAGVWAGRFALAGSLLVL